jgi:hypothetical protein
MFLTKARTSGNENRLIHIKANSVGVGRASPDLLMGRLSSVGESFMPLQFKDLLAAAGRRALLCGHRRAQSPVSENTLSAVLDGGLAANVRAHREPEEAPALLTAGASGIIAGFSQRMPFFKGSA